MNVIAAFMLVLASQGWGYENICSHPKITTNAIALLPTYGELTLNSPMLTLGAHDEDNEDEVGKIRPLSGRNTSHRHRVAPFPPKRKSPRIAAEKSKVEFWCAGAEI